MVVTCPRLPCAWLNGCGRGSTALCWWNSGLTNLVSTQIMKVSVDWWWLINMWAFGILEYVFCWLIIGGFESIQQKETDTTLYSTSNSIKAWARCKISDNLIRRLPYWFPHHALHLHMAHVPGLGLQLLRLSWGVLLKLWAFTLEQATVEQTPI